MTVEAIGHYATPNKWEAHKEECALADDNTFTISHIPFLYKDKWRLAVAIKCKCNRRFLLDFTGSEVKVTKEK